MTLTQDTPRHVEVPNKLRTFKRMTPRGLKRTARHLVRAYGRATSSRRALPNFLIVGAKRGGTTSLWNWLAEHPSVMPMFPAAQQIKSPHYFDIHFDKGEAWYRSHFPTESTLQRREALCGEASPYYIFHPLAPQRVAKLVPNVKLIISLRNPVDRAYSNYWERRGSGYETLPTFEDAIDAEAERLAGQEAQILQNPNFYSAEHDNHSYLARGRYLEHLQRWLDLFPREQILILRFEDLVADEVSTWQRVQQFLGLPLAGKSPSERYNRLPVPPLNPDTRARLTEYYAEHNAKLEAALEMSLGW